jgi:hypothetical protein
MEWKTTSDSLSESFRLEGCREARPEDGTASDDSDHLLT